MIHSTNDAAVRMQGNTHKRSRKPSPKTLVRYAAQPASDSPKPHGGPLARGRFASLTQRQLDTHALPRRSNPDRIHGHDCAPPFPPLRSHWVPGRQFSSHRRICNNLGRCPCLCPFKSILGQRRLTVVAVISSIGLHHLRFQHLQKGREGGGGDGRATGKVGEGVCRCDVIF